MAIWMEAMLRQDVVMTMVVMHKRASTGHGAVPRAFRPHQAALRARPGDGNNGRLGADPLERAACAARGVASHQHGNGVSSCHWRREGAGSHNAITAAALPATLAITVTVSTCHAMHAERSLRRLRRTEEAAAPPRQLRAAAVQPAQVLERVQLSFRRRSADVTRT